MNAPEAVDTGPQPAPTHGFTKCDRLLHRNQFVDLTKRGKKLQNKYFIAFVSKNARTHCRLGITVTRKVGNAATRNRIKRMAREYFRLHRQILKHNWDINLIAKTEASDISNKIIVISLENLFARIAAIDHG